VLAQMAARGLGTAIIPRSVARLSDELVALPLGDPQISGRVVIAWRVEGPLGPAAAALIEYARTSLPQRHGDDRR
jgi:DNA-binding transcriptional LysR family regulator